MKHVLIIDGFIPVHQQLQKLGAKLTIICETGRIKGKFPKLYYRKIEVPWESTDEERIEFAKTINFVDTIDAILDSHENKQDLTAKIAKTLNLPYNDLSCIEKIYDKEKMRHFLNENCMDATVGKRLKDKKELMEFIEEYGYPVVIKPVDGWASKGVSIVYGKEDIELALNWIEDTEYYQIYVEEFIDGTEYSVESFTEKGKSRVVAITKKFKSEKHCIEVGQCVPAKISNDLKRNIELFIQNFLNKMGFKYGPAHTEIMVRKNNVISVIETHCRLGGDNIPELVKNALGIDMIDLWARQVLGEEVMDRLDSKGDRYSAIWFIIPKENGIIDSIPNLEDYYDDNIDIKMYKEPGDEVSELKDSYSRLGHVIVTGEEYEKTIERAKTLAKKIADNVKIKKD